MGTNTGTATPVGSDGQALYGVAQVRREFAERINQLAGDPTTRRMLESILEDEEEHANVLADLLAAIDPRSEPR